MPSVSLKQWQTVRAATLDEIEAAHASVGGTGRGRRYATHQINHVYTVLLSSQFQGFCRDLRSESVDTLTQAIAPAVLQGVLKTEWEWERRLDKGNPTEQNIGSDFNRLGLLFWQEVSAADRRNRLRRTRLEEMNRWRNAVSHQDFSRVQVGGVVPVLHLSRVKQWRKSCDGLVRSFDSVLAAYLTKVSGAPPW